jgi:hypothetical protein
MTEKLTDCIGSFLDLLADRIQNRGLPSQRRHHLIIRLGALRPNGLKQLIKPFIIHRTQLHDHFEIFDTVLDDGDIRSGDGDRCLPQLGLDLRIRQRGEEAVHAIEVEEELIGPHLRDPAQLQEVILESVEGEVDQLDTVREEVGCGQIPADTLGGSTEEPTEVFDVGIFFTHRVHQGPVDMSTRTHTHT